MTDCRGEPPVYVVAATTNHAKRVKLQEIAGSNGIVVSPPAGLAARLRHELADSEDAGSIAAIARAKALVWSRALPGEVVVATDGGLVVPALGSKWNPARTRRFAGGSVTDEARARALLALAADLEGAQRTISWREALVLACNGRIIGQWVEESAGGLLATDVDPRLIEHGAGFWVPAIWLCPGAGYQPLATLSEPDQAVCQDHWTKLGDHFHRALRLLANA